MVVVKLQSLFALIGDNWPHGSVGILQAWLVAAVPSKHVQHDYVLFADPALVVSNTKFRDFRKKSCGMPLQLSSSMPGRVWCTGAVQIVQNVLTIPPRLHPRTSLSDDDARQVSELVYMPVYDLSLASGHPVAVLEVLFTSSTVLMADFISFVGQTLTQLQMSFTNPFPVAGGGGGTLIRRRADGSTAVRGQSPPATAEASDDGCGGAGVDQERLRMAGLAVSSTAAFGPEARQPGWQHCEQSAGHARDSGVAQTHGAAPSPDPRVARQDVTAAAAVAGCCGNAAMRRVRSVAMFGGGAAALMSHGGADICAMA